MLLDNSVFAQISDDLKTQGWSHTPSVFSPLELNPINNFFDKNQNDFKPMLVLLNDRAQRNEMFRGDYSLRLTQERKPQDFPDYESFLNQLILSINQSGFFSVEGFHIDASYFLPTHFFKTHMDVYSDPLQILTFIFYTHDEWTEKDGGNLVLYDKDMTHLKSVSPTPGSFMIFKSRDFPHEVRMCFKERRCLKGWMYGR